MPTPLDKEDLYVGEEERTTYRCKSCGQDKPLDAFFRRASAPHGRQYRCKQCSAALRPDRSTRRHLLAPTPERSAEILMQMRQWDAARRMARRLARANMIIDLCAQEYGLERHRLLGPRRSGRIYEAQALTTCAVRRHCYLHYEALAELLACPVAEIDARLRAARTWTSYDRGDVRIFDRMQRICRAYQREKNNLAASAQPYHHYSAAQRKPGTSHRNQLCAYE